MPFPRAPGVYFEPADAPAWSVEEVRTDVAGFVGLAERGPLHEPVRVESYLQFYTRFGGADLSYTLLPHAVRGFFENGGQVAWIVRVGTLVDRGAHATLDLVDRHGNVAFRIRAKDPGLGSGRLSIRCVPSVQNRFHLCIAAPAENGSGNQQTLEEWRDLSSQEFEDPAEKFGDERYLLSVINPPIPQGDYRSYPPEFVELPASQRNRGSCLITIERVGENTNVQVAGFRSRKSGTKRFELTQEARLGWDLAGGIAERSVLNGFTLEYLIGNELNGFGLRALERVDEVSLVAIPDLMWNQPQRKSHVPSRSPCSTLPDPEEPVVDVPRSPFTATERRKGQLALLEHCANLRDRFAILDAPPDLLPQHIERWRVQELESQYGQFGALYYPWIGVPSKSGGVHWLPPSGHVAGLYARVDLNAGVQQAPANEVLVAVQGVRTEVDSQQHGQLNLAGVNVIRATGPRGVRVLGARTLAETSDPEQKPWQYISVRRLLLMLEESLEQAGFGLVHANNNPQLWRDTERVVYEFLLRQWRQGRLGGSRPEEAFSVECNESTNPPERVLRGELTCVLGVQPPLPAEFVLVRLGRRGGGAGTWSGGSARG